jgi:hypothetical protein
MVRIIHQFVVGLYFKLYYFETHTFWFILSHNRLSWRPVKFKIAAKALDRVAQSFQLSRQMGRGNHRAFCQFHHFREPPVWML